MSKKKKKDLPLKSDILVLSEDIWSNEEHELLSLTLDIPSNNPQSQGSLFLWLGIRSHSEKQCGISGFHPHKFEVVQYINHSLILSHFSESRTIEKHVGKELYETGLGREESAMDV